MYGEVLQRCLLILYKIKKAIHAKKDDEKTERRKNLEIYDIIVVGAGPAGMTAAIYAARAGKKVLVIEGSAYGGQIIQSRKVENYPGVPDISGTELADRMMQQLHALDVALVSMQVSALNKQNGIFSVSCGNEAYAAKAVILATGVGHRKLEVAGEERLIGKGVSFCAACDGMFFRKRNVAVVGGGNTAVQDALVLSELCSKVYLIHRRNGFRAEARLMERLYALKNIEIITDTVVTAMEGAQRLEALLLENRTTGEKHRLEVAGVFEAIGTIARNAAFADAVTLDANGYIVTDENCIAATDGIFAAGDCRQKAVRQLTTATADGTVAALSAIAYLNQ